MRFLFRCKCCGMAYERKDKDDLSPCYDCDVLSTIKLPGKRILGYVELIGEVHLH